MKLLPLLILSTCLALPVLPAQAALWRTTELHYQQGRLDAPTFAGGGRASTRILTLQNAVGWQYVEVFFFLDFIEDSRRDGFNDSDRYGEIYVSGNLNTLFGWDDWSGPLRGVSWVAGYNHADEARVRKYLPGLRLNWNAPGFAFLNTDITAYIDDSRGVASGGAPRETDSFMVDFSWLLPFELGAQGFEFTGHAEYIGSRRNEFGGKVSGWLLAQPQFRWDVGRAAGSKPGRWFMGIEYQYWRNKLGDPATDESAAQFLLVWRL